MNRSDLLPYFLKAIAIDNGKSVALALNNITALNLTGTIDNVQLEKVVSHYFLENNARLTLFDSENTVNEMMRKCLTWANIRPSSLALPADSHCIISCMVACLVYDNQFALLYAGIQTRHFWEIFAVVISMGTLCLPGTEGS